VGNWRDNAGLPSLIDALRDVKNKHPQMSWGDFIVYAGNYVIAEMGGPKTRFCGGRVDATEEENRDEASYFNADRVEKWHDLIYVDPGQDGAPEVRETFNGNMGFSDQLTVAIIGGGHAFGGCHATRSGFSGYWTETPSKWTNDYFHQLLEETYEPFVVKETGNPQLVNPKTGLMMLKTDVALTMDPDYRQWVEMYANNIQMLEADFAKGWTQLMNRDMGDKPCLGPQYPTIKTLRPATTDVSTVEGSLTDTFAGDKKLAAKMARLAWRCAATFRFTDYRGGCDGATIRHEPESGFKANNGVVGLLDSMEGVVKASGLTTADFIVLAGNAAVQALGGPKMPFCHGREDEWNGERSQYLGEVSPLANGELEASKIHENFKLMGLNFEETIALVIGGESMGLATADFTANAINPHFGSADLNSRVLGKLVNHSSKYAEIAESLNGDADALKGAFANVWTKLMNQDRYHGICDPYLGADSATRIDEGKTEL